MRSLLRVPVRLEGEIVGGLNFLSRTLGQYREEDADIARRIADQVALVLSHEKLAEEARIAAEAREEALRLEGRLAALMEAFASYLGGPRQIIGNSKSWREVLDLVSRVSPTDTSDAIRGAPPTMAISPTASPTARVAIARPSCSTRTPPVMTTYIASPGSPCRKITSPSANDRSVAIRATCCRSAGSSASKSETLCRNRTRSMSGTVPSPAMPSPPCSAA